MSATLAHVALGETMQLSKQSKLATEAQQALADIKAARMDEATQQREVDAEALRHAAKPAPTHCGVARTTCRGHKPAVQCFT